MSITAAEYYTEDKKEHVACPVCAADAATLRFVEWGFRIVQCRRCGTAYVNPRLTAAELLRCYAQPYTTRSARASGSSLPAQLALKQAEDFVERPVLDTGAEFRFALRQVKDLGVAGGRFLDVGCGVSARFLREAMAAGFAAHGFELDIEAYREVMASHRRLGIRLFLGTDFSQTGFPVEFDVVSLWEVLEHIPNPDAYVRKAFAVLRPGGLFVVQVPNFTFAYLKARVLSALLPREPAFKNYKWISPAGLFNPDQHITFWTRRSLAAQLRRAGFRAVRFFPCPAYQTHHWLQRLHREVNFRITGLLDHLTGGALYLPYNILAIARK